MGILKGDWRYCSRCGYPNEKDRGYCVECCLEFEGTTGDGDNDDGDNNDGNDGVEVNT